MASIRRIIADEDAPASSPPSRRPGPSASHAAYAPRRAAAEAPRAEPGFAPVEQPNYPAERQGAPARDYPQQPEPRMQDPAYEAAPRRPVDPAPQQRPATQQAPQGRAPAAEPAPAARAEAPRRKDLLSPAVDAAVAAAFESLGDLVLPQHDRTVEDLVKEILRPMLKTWLDENLPGIVERLVRAEIERVSRSAR